MHIRYLIGVVLGLAIMLSSCSVLDYIYSPDPEPVAKEDGYEVVYHVPVTRTDDVGSSTIVNKVFKVDKKVEIGDTISVLERRYSNTEAEIISIAVIHGAK